MTLIIIFSISFAGLVGILVYQTRRVKLGKVAMIYDDPFDWPELKNRFANWLLDFAREMVITGLRLYIRVIYFLKTQQEHSRRQFDLIKQKIGKFIEKEKKSGPVSDFLSTIGEYKEKIQEIKKEIEKEEK